MLETAPLAGAVTFLTTAVSFRARSPDLLACLRANWLCLDASEAAILYRAACTAHWRAVRQISEEYAARHDLDRWARAALRDLAAGCEARLPATEDASPPAMQWEAAIESAFRTLAVQAEQGRDPPPGPGEQAWSALVGDFPAVPYCPGLRDRFDERWYVDFTAHFERLAVEPDAATILTGKLFAGVRGRAGYALEPQAILDSLPAAAHALRDSLTSQGRRREAASLGMLDAIRAELENPRRAPALEPLVGVENAHGPILAREAEAEALLAALRQPGPGIVSLAAPAGCGKSALLALALRRAMPNSEPAEAGMAGVAVLDARLARPDIPTFAHCLGRITGWQELAARFAVVRVAGEAQHAELRALFFDFLRHAGPVWLVLENADGALTPTLAPEFRTLLQAWCREEHGAKLVLLARQALPASPACYRRLPRVEQALAAGLPVERAVEFLRGRLEGTSLASAEDGRLADMARRLHCIPMALEQFAGRLRDAPRARAEELLPASALLEAQLAGLIGERLRALDGDAWLALRVVAWTAGSVPAAALLAVLHDLGGSTSAASLDALARGGLLMAIAGATAEGLRYAVHPLVRECVAGIGGEDLPLERLARAFGSAGSAEASRRAEGSVRGALALFAWAERAQRQVAERDSGREAANDLAAAIGHRARALWDAGRLPDAVTAYAEAAAILQRLAREEEYRSPTLARILLDRANALGDAGRVAEAVDAFEEAIGILRQLAEEEGRREFANDLAKALMNRAVALDELGRVREALAAYEEAIAILRSLVEQEGRRELANSLAAALMNRAVALDDLGRRAEAVEACDEAIALRRTLVEQEGRGDLANDLAGALLNRGAALGSAGRLAEAVEACDEAIALLRRLVDDDGQRELANELAGAILNRGEALRRQGRAREALEACEEAIAIRRRLVEEEGRRELAEDLAKAVMNRAAALKGLGRLSESAGACGEAIEIFGRLRDGRRGVGAPLALAYYNLALARGAMRERQSALAAAREARRLWTELIESGMQHLESDWSDAGDLVRYLEQKE